MQNKQSPAEYCSETGQKGNKGVQKGRIRNILKCFRVKETTKEQINAAAVKKKNKRDPTG